MIANNRLFQEVDHRNNELVLFIGALFVVSKNTKNPKQIVITLTFELERGSKLKVDEIRRFLPHLNGYNSVCLLKPATPLRSPVRLN